MGKTTVESDWKEDNFLDSVKDFQLVYLFSNTPVEFRNRGIRKVDTKVVFQKALLQAFPQSEIQPYRDELSKDLEQLAYLSGIHSRFLTDPRLQQGEFRKLYTIWISKAWETKKILVAPGLAGMVTVSVEQSKAAIGLIAVSEKHQGKGWGKKLIRAAEYQGLQEGAKEMLIPTQESNVPACGLYKSLGYKPVERTYIYHYWNTDFQDQKR